nr:MAG TPA: hypothetical protein [Caudoviricetes sp.]DAX42000.1 MAG TPA: hypothetical protein [Caudoviricetes sp.]
MFTILFIVYSYVYSMIILRVKRLTDNVKLSRWRAVGVVAR